MRCREMASRLIVVLTACFLLEARSNSQIESKSPSSLYDPRLGEMRRASVKWDRRAGPVRKVIDQVVLVPDAAAFYEAIAAWDESAWFPILIDEAELAPKFVRAFRPARVIRYPGRPKPIPDNLVWERAQSATAKSWGRKPQVPPALPEKDSSAEIAKSERDLDQVHQANVVPRWLGPTPPGVVLSNAKSPSLPGAVALAAGRFQPLVQWDPTVRKGGNPNEEEARTLSFELEKVVASVVDQYSSLGDDCDFLTLAAPYPDRFVVGGAGLKAGVASFDDLVGRDHESLRRWAYAGRLSGDAPESVYRAMCALFLQPHSALLFDAYDPADADFLPYTMSAAARKLPTDLKSTLVDGAKADVSGWHRMIDPLNRFGFVFINSSGGSQNFMLAGHTRATTGDIPATVPAVVLMNHSFSATSPSDPKSLAGAWLSGRRVPLLRFVERAIHLVVPHAEPGRVADHRRTADLRVCSDGA